MKIQDIKTIQIKKLIGAKSVRFSWHNKNKTGGNFGINVIGVNGNDYAITGRYNITGTVRNLRFGFLLGISIPMNVKTVDEMLEFITKTIKTSE